MKLLKRAAFLGCFLTFGNIAAQDNLRAVPNEIDEPESRQNMPFDLNLQVKNMHLWKGLRVAEAPVVTANLHFSSLDGKFRAGVWGGVGFTGDFTEFDYYASYADNGFSISIWDINNFSDYPDAEIFNYDKAVTSHFIDVTVAYKLTGIPLKFSWSTLVQGRDTYIADNGKLKNAFSNYVEAAYSLYDEESWSLGAYVGGAFSFRSEAHFYGDHPNVTNFGFVYKRNFQVLQSYRLPVSATISWNPEQQYGSVQIAVNLF